MDFWMFAGFYITSEHRKVGFIEARLHVLV